MEQIKKQENNQTTVQQKEKKNSQQKLKTRTADRSETAEARAVPSEQGGKPTIQAKTAGGKRMTLIPSKHQPVPSKHQPVQRAENKAVADIEDDFDEVELTKDSGNTEIIKKAGKFAKKRLSKKEEKNKKRANDLLVVLDGISPDRLRIVVFSLIREKYYDNFIAKITPYKNEETTPIADKITNLRTEFTDPTAGTKAASAEQIKNIENILHPSREPAKGKEEDKKEKKKFIDLIDNDPEKSLHKDILKTLNAEVEARYPDYEKRDKKPRFNWSPYKKIAHEAKRVTDDLYGHYDTKSKPITPHGSDANLFDRHETPVKLADLGVLAKYFVAVYKPEKPIYPGTTVGAKHHANFGQKLEKSILNKAIATWLMDTKNRKKLELIMKNWGGGEKGGKIFIQRIDHQHEGMNRLYFWKTFQTLIHEYIHSITSKEYSKKARASGMGELYTEGGTAYFEEKVWKAIYPQEIQNNGALRFRVEGLVYPYEPKVIPTWKGYPQRHQFGAIVNEVGEKNAMAAFFKGETDRIGLGK